MPGLAFFRSDCAKLCTFIAVSGPSGRVIGDRSIGLKTADLPIASAGAGAGGWPTLSLNLANFEAAYDFVVWSHAKRLEKLRYIHRNPVKRGLVLEPAQWSWSSFRHYAYGEAGPFCSMSSSPPN
jgi:hypothetical protein